MQGKLRHTGILVTNLHQAEEFYRSLGFKTFLKSKEKWDGQELEIYKMVDWSGGTLELVKGNWHPHLAITLHPNESIDDLWERFATKSDVLITRKQKGKTTIIYMKDPSGNWVEVVKE